MTETMIKKQQILIIELIEGRVALGKIKRLKLVNKIRGKTNITTDTKEIQRIMRTCLKFCILPNNCF